MKPLLRAALLAMAVTTGTTACQQGVYYCACPAAMGPLRVCGTFLNRDDAVVVPVAERWLSAPRAHVEHAPRRSVLPRPATWAAVRNRTIVAITISTNCARAPVVTVTPAAAARTVVAALGSNGGIAGLTLAMLSNTAIVVRAYRGHRLLGRVTLPYQAAAVPPPSPAPTPSHASSPCRRAGSPGGQEPGPLYCLSGPLPPVSAG